MESYKKEYNNLSLKVLVNGETLFTRVDDYTSIMPWKNNLLACSQTNPYLFLGVNNNIYVYKIINEKEFSKEPYIILKTGNNSEISINSIKMGFLYDEEILIAVCDNGVIAIFFISNLEHEPIKIINDDDVSTWGIAIYGPLGYIAVSANNFQIKLYKILKNEDIPDKNNNIINAQNIVKENNEENSEENIKGESSNINDKNENLVNSLKKTKESDSESSFNSEDNDFNKQNSGTVIKNHTKYLLGKECIYFKGHKHNIPNISFSEDGRYLISGSIDSTIKIWNVKTGKRLYSKVLERNGWVWAEKFIEINHGYVYKKEVVDKYLGSLHVHDDIMDRFLALGRFFPNITGNIRDLISRGEIFINSVNVNQTLNTETEEEENQNMNSLDDNIDIIDSGSEISLRDDQNIIENQDQDLYDSETDERGENEYIFKHHSCNSSNENKEKINKKRSYNSMRNDRVNILGMNDESHDITIPSYDLMGNHKLQTQNTDDSTKELFTIKKKEKIKDTDQHDISESLIDGNKGKKKKSDNESNTAESSQNNNNVQVLNIVDNPDYHEINIESTHFNLPNQLHSIHEVEIDEVPHNHHNDHEELNRFPEVHSSHSSDSNASHHLPNFNERFRTPLDTSSEPDEIYNIEFGTHFWNAPERNQSGHNSDPSNYESGIDMIEDSNTNLNTNDNEDNDSITSDNIFYDVLPNADFFNEEVFVDPMDNEEYFSDIHDNNHIPSDIDINISDDNHNPADRREENSIFREDQNGNNNEFDRVFDRYTTNSSNNSRLLDEVEDSDEDFPILNDYNDYYDSIDESFDEDSSFETTSSDDLHIVHSDTEEKELTISINNNTFIIASTVSDIFLLDKTGKIIDVLENPFQPYCKSLNRYSRINILEWISDMDVAVVANQKGIFGLLRIINFKDDHSYKMVIETFQPEKSPLYPLAGLSIKPYYSSNDPLLSYYLIYVTYLNGSIYIFKLKHNTNSFPLSLTQL